MSIEKVLIAAVIGLMAVQAIGFLIAAAWKFTEADFLAGTASFGVALGFSFVAYTALRILRSENRRKK